ncbi:DUF1934 domain-containing protein [Lysinibacillus piscis]|nr:DUF1934 domain-containing protein [Lysinibacillus sp. KH24]
MANEVKSQVSIHLTSMIQPTDGEQEMTEMWLTGQLLEKAGSTYLKYEEIEEGQVIRTTMKLDHDKALIMRAGAVNMRLPLNRLEQQNGHYEGDFGSMPLVVQTKQLSFTKQETSGQFHVQYDLIISGQSAGNYTVDITFMEVQ